MFGGAAVFSTARRMWAADAQQQIFDLFSKIASALSDDDPAMFLESLDPAMPRLADFRRNLVALTDVADLSNSLEVVNETGDENARNAEVDWFLEIVGKSASHTVERRREVVKFRLERKGKKWKIVSIEPLQFFAPPKDI